MWLSGGTWENIRFEVDFAVGYLEVRRLFLSGVAWNAGLHIVISAFG
jgi:hypothetical protein